MSEVSAAAETRSADFFRKRPAAYQAAILHRSVAIQMPDLLADRFLPLGTTWVDLASGATVRVRLAAAGSEVDRLAWSDWCATFARMRHPLLNQLVDYGFVDSSRRFEAYGVAGPVPANGATILGHAVRFLEAHAVHLQPDVASLALRQVCAAQGTPRRRPLGILLQPRRALAALDEALTDAAPGGVAVLSVTGRRGSGLRTLRDQVARSARLQGYVPVAAGLLAAAPGIVRRIRDRHICMLLDGDAPRAVEQSAAALSAALGLESARRHILIRFTRAPTAAAHVFLEPMGVTAMISMVFMDRESGPDQSRVIAAARGAEGSPGRFLLHLGASAFPEHRPASFAVHETAPAYVVRPIAVSEAQHTPDSDSIEDTDAPMPGSRAPGHSILSAPARAARLAARGRHASAIRLLTRATRVLERRGEHLLAARCAEQLGWILRDRGRAGEALEQFARSVALAGDKIQEIRGAIATGIAWTDQCRFTEAEAALRSALTAAELLRDISLAHRARLGLARCLYWNRRPEEAALALEPVLLDGSAPRLRLEALALSARISIARGNLRAAMASANEAFAAVDPREARLHATAARAMACAQAAAGDDRGAWVSIRQGLAAAAAAHAPLQALRLRAMSRRLACRHGASTTDRSCRGNLARGSLPPLVRQQLEDDPSRIQESPHLGGGALPSSAVQELQDLLDLAYNAQDDGAGVAAVSKALCERLRAATVQVVSADADRRLLVRVGRCWTGDLRLVERAIAGTGPGAVFSTEPPHEAAQPVSYGNQTIAVVACRWTPTASIDPHSAAALLRTGALAVAPAVRALLDRRPALDAEPAWQELIGTSAQTLSLRGAITRAARAPFPVLIDGESGSGKELVARAIHRLSPRRDRRLCAVNCAALSEDLLEAELFGHARGAFTGAVGERAGLFEEADSGTLFLDEVGELSPRAQAKLLRVLQDGEVRRVGETFARRVDARVIAATNRRLEEEVSAGRFRADLQFRLDVVRISVPPLRDRPVDIPLLVAHFWEEATRRVHSRASLAPETVQALTRYDWPGNVRQLQNVIASLAVHAPRRGRVPPSLLPAHVARTAGAAATTFGAAREEFERRFVLAALARAGGHRARAARALGVTRQGLAKMMKRLGVEDER